MNDRMIFKGHIVNQKDYELSYFNNGLGYTIELFNKRMRFKPRYGTASSDDFGNLSNALAVLCSYNNKQYYIYRAISDKNKVGFLSRKQYVKCLSIYKKQGKEAADEYKKANGRMISLYKMLTNAIEENPFAKFLKVFAVFGERRKDIFEKFCEKIMSITDCNSYEILPCSVQEAYDLDLRYLNHTRGRGIGSGARYAITSCMQGKKISFFYEGFGAQAYKVVHEGEAVGRFLTWKTNKGRTFVDRLYCNGYDAERALSAIEKKFGEDAVYYPFNCLPDDEWIEVANPSKFRVSGANPYVDSMRYISIEPDSDKLYLSNRRIPDTNMFSAGNYHERFKICKCGKILRKGEIHSHEAECSMVVKRKRNIKEVPEILKLYKEVFENESVF